MAGYKIPLTIMFLLLYLGGNEDVGLYVQAASVCILTGSAAWAVFAERRLFSRKVDALPALFFVLIVPILSILNGIVRETDYQIVYGFLFMLTAGSVWILGDRVSLVDLFVAYLIASVAAIVFFLAIEFELLKAALSVQVDKDGLLRFSPLGMHPNLVGHVFGGFLVYSAIKSYFSKSLFSRLGFAVLASIGIVFVVAASSRGGLLAALMAVFVTFVVSWSGSNAVGRRYFNPLPVVAFVGTGIVFVAAFGWEDFSTILELDSQHRGLSSGLSGRTDAWPAVISNTVNDGWASLFGFGLRSWSTETMGFPVDNSFVELVNDNGFFIAAAVIALVVYRVLWLRSQGARGREGFALLVFCLVESFVARYLLGIGNPVSLVVLWLLLSRNSGVRQLNQTKLGG